jgi:EAL domain-containing protein (putative c-di-GMP-specific phosphodiesterase class I)
VDTAEALHAGSLELWYQPKIDMRTLALSGAEALAPIRHRTLGVLPPEYVMPDDPHVGAVSELVIDRMINDWRYFTAQHGHIEIAVNLPITLFRDPELIEHLYRRIPDHPAFEGLIVQVNAADVVRNLGLVKKVARLLRYRTIAVSIGDLGAEWPSLTGLGDFPFVELKVARQFIAGCAGDRRKRAACRRIIDLADAMGARTVADAVENRADFLAARELGFSLAQGALFAKPMTAKNFARSVPGRGAPWPLA